MRPLAAHLGLVLLLILGGGQLVRACQIPVFRYALERWDAEPYELVIFHRGPLPAAERSALDMLKRAGGTVVNLEPRLVDLSGEVTEEDQALWQAQQSAAVPWMVLRYPRSPADFPSILAAPLDEPSARAVIDSPARREIVRRIAGGESAVWVVIDSGDQAADEAAVKLLQTELDRAQKELKLPDLTIDDGGPKLLSQLPVRLAFSVLRVAREDAAERVLVQMLLASDPNLSAGPAIFPVFGQGRVLGALSGQLIAAEPIAQGCGFIAGACSCQAKELNPGFDLLLRADWNAILDGRAETELPALATVTADGPNSRGILGSSAALLTIAILVLGYLAWRTRAGAGRYS